MTGNRIGTWGAWLAAGILLFTVTGCSQLPSWAGGTAKKTVDPLPGERVSVLRSATSLTTDSILSGVPPIVPSPSANDGWAQHSANFDPATANLALTIPLENSRSESIGDGADFPYGLVVTPIVAGGVVYAMDAEGRISAHEAKNIDEVLWISPGVATDDEEAVMGGGLAYADGRVYASSGKGLIAAIDAKSGVEIWRQTLNIPIRSAPRVEGGRVFTVTVDSQLFAMDANNGAVLWNHRGVSEGTGFLIEASPAVSGDFVLAPYSSGEVHVLHADDGSDVWSDTVMGPQRQSATAIFTGIGGDPVVTDGTVYVAGSAGQLAAFQLNSGQRLWEQPVSSINTPWIVGDTVYVLTSDSVVVAFHAMDGRVRWQRALPAYENEEEKTGRYTWSGPVMAGDKLLIVGAHGEMQVLSPQDGSVLATQEIPEGVAMAPVIAGGVLYLVTLDATLHALY